MSRFLTVLAASFFYTGDAMGRNKLTRVKVKYGWYIERRRKLGLNTQQQLCDAFEDEYGESLTPRSVQNYEKQGWPLKWYQRMIMMFKRRGKKGWTQII